jgi:hypothetical protein
MNIHAQEEHDFHASTATEWDNAEARELGETNPDQAWVLTDRDVWHFNPFYVGPPIPHPEEITEGFDYSIWWLFELESHHRGRPYVEPRDEDIPF